MILDTWAAGIRFVQIQLLFEAVHKMVRIFRTISDYVIKLTTVHPKRVYTKSIYFFTGPPEFTGLMELVMITGKD